MKRWPLRQIAALILAAWTAGLVVASVQLSAWNDELVRTLLQIRADTVFRTRMAQYHETIPREWYRSKALSLLAASEKLHDDTGWMLFVPGSWPPFDDLRERLAQRIEREFSETAVDTMRRELFYRASRLTGVAQDPATADLLVGADCARPPVPMGLDADRSGPRELPEFVAVQSHLEALEQLDQAVGAMIALQDPATANGEHLRVLARYTLGAELPGRLSRGAAFVRGGLQPADAPLGAMRLASLRYAARCSLGKAMAALDTRFFERNDLLATEGYLAQRWARLFAPNARPLSYADTVQGLREVIAALDEEDAMLAQGDYAWLHHATASLGPAHDGLLAHISSIKLLGPEAVDQVRQRSAVALRPFRNQFARAFDAGHANGEPGLVWLEDRGRLALSPQRVALRNGLVALLREPFMAEPAGHAFALDAPSPLSWDLQRLEGALILSVVRRRFASDSLPAFPIATRAGIAQIVNAQLAQRVQDATVEAMAPARPGEPPAPFDAAAFRAQREQLSKVQALLAELGAHPRANQLRAVLSRDLVERLALAEEAIWRMPLFSARTQDFGWWQGEGSPVLQAFGVADGLTLKYVLAQELGQLDEPARQAAALLAYADAAAAQSPTALRWQAMVPEVERYRSKTGGSLAALERYLLAVAPELNRWNCPDRLAAAAVAQQPADEFGRRQLHIHRALQSRCAELRSGRP